MTNYIFKCCLLLSFAIEILSSKCVNDRYYPRYHLAPYCGWMNDPNGFCFFRGKFRMFYQHNPDSSLVPGIAHWAYAVSSNLFHWVHKQIALYPDKSYDRTGVFSGSGDVYNDTMYLYYTGNVKYPDKTPSYKQYQALATSTDGEHFTKHENNPIIVSPNHQPNIRDPKVWQHGSNYYMVLGNSYENNTLGQVLLYVSDDKINWKEAGVIAKSNGDLGFMWECPDFIELNGIHYLIFSPQGVKSDGENYQNLYQTGYIAGKFSYDTLEFDQLTEFIELDRGHDFYATQSTLDSSGRRLLVAWCSMWERKYPDGEDGWSGQLTLIRELISTDDYRLIQKPVDEVEDIRGENLLDGKTDKGGVVLDDKAGEICITADWADLEVIIESVDGSAKVAIRYEHECGMMSLDRGGDDGMRRAPLKPSGSTLNLQIFVDASSIEVFCQGGILTFSSRYFPKDNVRVRLGSKVQNIKITSLKRSIFV